MTLPLSDKAPADPLALLARLNGLLDSENLHWSVQGELETAIQDRQEQLAEARRSETAQQKRSHEWRTRAMRLEGREAELVAALELLWNVCDYLSGGQWGEVDELLARVKGGSDEWPAQW